MIDAPPLTISNYEESLIPRTTELIRSASQFASESTKRVPCITLEAIKTTISLTVIDLGDDSFLYLREKPTGKISPVDWKLTIDHWNIAIPLSEITTLGSKMARKFMYLWDKSTNMELTKQELSEWDCIHPLVDYNTFCLDHQSVLYTEGKLLNKLHLRVEWLNGDCENLRSFRGAFNYLEQGDQFGAMIKRNRHGEVISVSDIRPLTLT